MSAGRTTAGVVLAVLAALPCPALPGSRARAADDARRPLLRDEQTLGVWKGHEFTWQAVDPAGVRRVTFPVTVPAGHRYVTVAIDDAAGVRVRNLLDAVGVTKLGGKEDAAGPQTVVVEWNGLDDRGRPAADGTHRVRGCSHPGLRLTYEFSFLNPGRPPWEHYPNSGWGGDHGFPHALACLRGHGGGKWRVALGGRVAEGGSPGFILGEGDRKAHAFGRGWNGPRALAAADGQLWIGLSGGKDVLRLEYHTGKQVPFKTAKGPQPAVGFGADVAGIAVGKARVAVLLHDDKKPPAEKGRVVMFDRDTGENRAEVTLPAPGRRNGLVMGRDGKTVVAATGAGLGQFDITEAMPAWQPLAREGVSKPGPVAADGSGNLYVLERGADYQVKVFSPEGKPLRAVGTRGGQGERLEFDPAALHGVEAISVDDEGNLWVAENGDLDRLPGTGFVRRVAVWDREGRFVKDFVGPTWYSANTTCLHEQDPGLAYGYGVIYRRAVGEKPAFRPWRYAVRPQPEGAPFWLWTASPGVLFNAVRMFRSDASGAMREYLLQSSGFPILFQAGEDGAYRPVLAIGSHEMSKAFPKAADEPKALFLWTDLDGNGRPSDGEFQRVPGTTYNVAFFAGWGYPPPRDLAWYVEGKELRPVRFTDRGVPVYDVAKARAFPVPQHYLAVGEHRVAVVARKWDSPEAGYYFAGRYLFTDRDGKPVATYRANWPAVHASWKSSLPKPGQTGRTAGELFLAGTAPSGGELGHVLCAQGNKGQSFLFSEDGLFVGTLFRDSRQSPKGWGAKEEPGADWTDVTLYDEPFGGWFGRQADGVVRYLFGRTGCQVVRVEGLEGVKRLDAGTVRLHGPAGGGMPLPASAPEERVLRVRDVRGRFPPLKVDGDPADWQGLPRREIKVGEQTVARLAVAHTLDHLWLLAEVDDPSPARNDAPDPKLAFKSGDGLDVLLGPDGPPRPAAGPGDVRVLIVPGAKRPVVMAYRPVKAGAKPEEVYTFASPVKLLTFASVAAVAEAQAAFRKTPTGSVVEVKLPCDRVELRHAESGLRLRGDVGILWGNEAGRVTERRAYLFSRNPEAGVVSDTPTEAELHPDAWGVWVLE